MSSTAAVLAASKPKGEPASMQQCCWMD